ncbi:DnaJ domain-containing protein [Roseobacter sp. HKCCD9010]|uniref:molecular chaperone DjiA n=1 Tax=unclassified Roseobacter TaxID=196798 RepID=UPI0014923804|nr:MULTISPECIES: molecular chaperone DjiA [unclassified Roseobacter]MBF9048888.1 DnaJ domain-containing protein [Rhodobacterales bacterium HKCCD4356]NNV10887.1 DnaJ domain-containing protein [Roseobacter sp. HKCCD7357]NNV15072.1 DnaJ domain-containing protein [Roseobacter sp. HKCCD8768]NNV24531.1 DnaJ domain-containing protein [Roseobacter sp. HKCCD8192]NNV28788.1 DnaJ domain-containing protein [Roseobacter sp. HKCCD9061]
MSIWSRISDALSALASGEGLGAVFDKLRTPPERSVAFTIAVIALSAKMAKADGLVTRDEVTAFRDVFHVPPEEEAAAARVFNLAREDVAGFEDYAARIARMFADDPAVLSDLMEGLFHIACADGQYHPNEDQFLERVAEIFNMAPRDFTSLRARHVPDAAPDPYVVLGVDTSMSLDEIRAIWRQQVRETHPDQMLGRGVPEEAIRLAERRMQAINEAWEEISAHHGS